MTKNFTLKFNGIVTDGKGNALLGIPVLISEGPIELNAGDLIEVGSIRYTIPMDGYYNINLSNFLKEDV